MMKLIPRRLAPRTIIVLSLALCSIVQAQSPSKPRETSGLEAKTQGMQHLAGFMPLYWDAKSGKLFLEIPRLSSDVLYVHSLPYGLGSNDLGLDRGQMSEPVIVHFERFGPKVLLVRNDEFFRSSAASASERLAVRQSFPDSVLAGFKVEAEAPGGGVLVDATEFFTRDVHGVLEALAENRQGSYKLDANRSAIAMDATRVFPKNTEVEALLTFTTESPESGSHVAEVAPDAHAFTVREHQSFVELPGPGYTPRRADPRSGYITLDYRDYAAPLGALLDQHLIARHRLIKKDPACTESCVAVQPIQYYVDRGAPEPIRTALVEGARWWDQAFQAAGFAPGTFRVEVLPENMDPMDVRYNMIQWVHRYTRGWSYGWPLHDPRTGEIIKGNVTLGSLRSRQDYLIATALLSPYVTGRTLTPENDPMLAMALARTRQLAAHETGHTLGLEHNFAASSFPHTPQESVSVMDYPYPWIVLGKDGIPDLSQAYGVNIGIWDKVAINYGYRQFSDAAQEKAGLDAILNEAHKQGMYFISDADARPEGGAHPHAHLWDNGADAAAELDRLMQIRAAALLRFGENAIPMGAPLAALEDTLVPLYFMHRYQAEAAIKEIGGLDYRFQLRGDGQMNAAIVDPQEQRKALHAVVATLSPEALVLPESLLKLLPPRPSGMPRTRESFASNTGVTFDPVAAAESAADLTLSVLFNPQRAARLLEYGARVQGPTLDEVIDAALTINRPAKRHEPKGLYAEIEGAVYMRTVEALLTLAASERSSASVKSDLFAKLDELKEHLEPSSAVDAFVVYRIDQFLADPKKFVIAAPVAAPPGAPIGESD
ncbi:MAG TPA: zinc-dependent metalloprotease [Steroidobacteraceae bacterium]|jgi:hypothetical protein